MTTTDTRDNLVTKYLKMAYRTASQFYQAAPRRRNLTWDETVAEAEYHLVRVATEYLDRGYDPDNEPALYHYLRRGIQNGLAGDDWKAAVVRPPGSSSAYMTRKCPTEGLFVRRKVLSFDVGRYDRAEQRPGPTIEAALEAVNKLGWAERQVVRMFHGLDGGRPRSFIAIAEETGWGVRRVRGLYHQALRQLREMVAAVCV